MRKYFLILLLIVSSICWGQDSAIQVFRVHKIYATAAGRRFDTIDRQELADSDGIVIHGCPDCKVLGFQLIVKTRPVTDTAKQVTSDFVEAARIKRGGIVYFNADTVGPPQLFSKTDLFTWEMKEYIGNYYRTLNTYYVEICNIRVRTPEGEEMTLDKICLYLK